MSSSTSKLSKPAGGWRPPARQPVRPSVRPQKNRASKGSDGRGRVHRCAAQSNCDSAEVPCIISLTWLPGERKRGRVLGELKQSDYVLNGERMEGKKE